MDAPIRQMQPARASPNVHPGATASGGSGRDVPWGPKPEMCEGGAPSALRQTPRAAKAVLQRRLCQDQGGRDIGEAGVADITKSRMAWVRRGLYYINYSHWRRGDNLAEPCG